MPLIRAELDHFTWKRGELSRTRQEVITKEIKTAAREWLEAVLTRVPVLTGEARGSLRPLGAFVDMRIPITPKVQRRDRGPAYGYDKATDTGDIFEFDGERFTFRFESRVWWYWYNEFHSVYYPKAQIDPPWLSFAQRPDLFRETLRQRLLKRLPSLLKFRSRVRVSAGHHGRG